MRSAGNFSPEWGYLAPVPSFMRTARVVVVATAVGATAGAGVVLSLIEHPAADVGNRTVAAHAIVTSVQAATPPVVPLANTAAAGTAAAANAPAPAQAQTTVPAQLPVMPRPLIATQSMPTPAVGGQPGSSGAAQAVPAPQSPPGVAALTEGAPATETAPAVTPDETTVAPEEVPPPKKPAAKHVGPNTANTKNNPSPNLGTVLRRLFTAHAGTSYYPNR